jgi:hypothetical protein
MEIKVRHQLAGERSRDADHQAQELNLAFVMFVATLPSNSL